MNILVIPDVHLKDWMFRRASEIMKERNIEKAVCLMDIPDDWGQERSVSSYESCYDAAIAFAKQYPKALWCCGKHDLSYIWAKPESGYSIYAAMTVKAKLKELKEALDNEFRLAYVHRIDNVLFSHGGVTQEFVRSHLPGRESRDTDVTIDLINSLGDREMWRENSPIWARPTLGITEMYKEKTMLQVTGHTPVKQITQEGNLIQCDVFSTYSNGMPYGSEEFLILDTKTWEWEGVR